MKKNDKYFLKFIYMNLFQIKTWKMSRNRFNRKLSFSLTFIIFCSYVAQGKFFKRILLPGTSWPSWVNNRRTPTNPSPFECIANCSSLGPTNCNVIFNDPLNNTCWMGLVGGNFGYQTLLGQPGDAWGMIDFGKTDLSPL